MYDYNKRTWWDWLVFGLAAIIGIPALVIIFWPGGFDVIQLMREHRVKVRMETIKANGYTAHGPSITWQSPKGRELVPPPLRLEDKAWQDLGLLPRESEPPPEAPTKLGLSPLRCVEAPGAAQAAMPAASHFLYTLNYAFLSSRAKPRDLMGRV